MPVATTDLVNDTNAAVYVQAGACSAQGRCNYGFVRGAEVQPGRSVPIPRFPGGTNAFSYRVTDASGRVLGCAKLGEPGQTRMAISTLPACT